MTTDPGYDSQKTQEVCPYCKEERGKEHKKSCGLWSPYSTLQWVKQPEKPIPAAIGLPIELWRGMGLKIDCLEAGLREVNRKTRSG